MIIACPSCSTRYEGPEGAELCRCAACDNVFRPRRPVPPYTVSARTRVEPPGEPAVEGLPPVLAVGIRLDRWSGDETGEDRPPRTVSAGLSIGLDDPTLAEKVSRSSLDLDGDTRGNVLTYQVVAEEEQPSEGPEITIALEDSEDRIALDPGVETAQEPTPCDFPGVPVMDVPAAPEPDLLPEPDAGPRSEPRTEPEAPAGAAPEPTVSPDTDEEGSEEEAPLRPGFGAFLMVLLIPALFAAGAWQYAPLLQQKPEVLAPAGGVLGLLFTWLWVRWKYRTR